MSNQSTPEQDVKPIRSVSGDGTVITDEDGDAFLDEQDTNV